jgi:hypothetical protein
MGGAARTAAATAWRRPATDPAAACAGQRGHHQPPGTPVTSQGSSTTALSAAALAPRRWTPLRPCLLAAGAVLAACEAAPSHRPRRAVSGAARGTGHQRWPRMTALTRSRPDAGSRAEHRFRSAPRRLRCRHTPRCCGRRTDGSRVRGGLRHRVAASRALRAGPCSSLRAGPSRDGGSSPGPWTPKPPAPWRPGTGPWTPATDGVSMTSPARLRQCPCLPGRRERPHQRSCCGHRPGRAHSRRRSSWTRTAALPCPAWPGSPGDQPGPWPAHEGAVRL